MRNSALTLTVAFCLVSVSFAQDDSDTPIPLYGNLGSYGKQITTASTMAQRYFDQGLQLARGFGRSAAVESFRMAQTHDRSCAMCYWEEAWALGPYQNGEMDEEAGKQAFQAIRKARELADSASPLEVALIRAMQVRYEAEPNEDHRRELDEKYVDAMREVVRTHPYDFDAAALFAESLMVLHPWDLWLEDGSARPATSEAIGVLESALARNIKHAGACHLYIHAVEASSDPRRGEACAYFLADEMPGASHIQHMPSHIYMRIGRYEDAVRANQRAHIVDLQAKLGQASAIYASHNLDMLVFAGWMDGQSAVAMQASKDLARTRESDAFHVYQMLVRFGRWEELLEMEESPEDPFIRAFWELGQGMAHLRLGHLDQARPSLDSLARLIDELEEDARYRRFSKREMLKVAKGLLEGEIAAAERRYKDAERLLRQAIAGEDKFPYSEPESWALPIRQYLGAMLLDAGRPGPAELVFREELKKHPENGWSLFGLAQSLRAQGKEDATAVEERFRKAWMRADLFLIASRF